MRGQVAPLGWSWLRLWGESVEEQSLVQGDGRIWLWELGFLETMGLAAGGPSSGPASRQGGSPGLVALLGALSLLSDPGPLSQASSGHKPGRI